MLLEVAFQRSSGVRRSFSQSRDTMSSGLTPFFRVLEPLLRALYSGEEDDITVMFSAVNGEEPRFLSGIYLAHYII